MTPSLSSSERRTTLAALPATLGDNADAPPWGIASTSRLMAELNTDRANWAMWRSRGLTPAPLPSAWFRPTAGRALFYRRDAVETWLAGRRGVPLDALTTWRRFLVANLGFADLSDDEVRAWAGRLARSAGPRAYAADGVVFTARGWDDYLATLVV